MTEENTVGTTLCLVRAAQRGDRKAMNDLFSRYYPLVCRIVALRMGSPIGRMLDQEDMVQDAFLHVFQNIQKFEARTEGSFRHWVATCVQNQINDAAAGAKAGKRGGGKVRAFGELGPESLSTAIFGSDSQTPSKVLSEKELNASVEAALLQLKPHHLEVIVLRSFCEMSYAEIAKTMGFDEEATARAAFSRACKKLKALLAA